MSYEIVIFVNCITLFADSLLHLIPGWHRCKFVYQKIDECPDARAEVFSVWINGQNIRGIVGVFGKQRHQFPGGQ